MFSCVHSCLLCSEQSSLPPVPGLLSIVLLVTVAVSRYPVILAHVSGIDICLLTWTRVSSLEAVPVLKELSRFQLVDVCDSQVVPW